MTQENSHTSSASNHVAFAVYNAETGEVVHVHRANAASGAVLPHHEELEKDALSQAEKHHAGKTLKAVALAAGDYEALSQGGSHFNLQAQKLEHTKKEAIMAKKEFSVTLAVEVDENTSPEHVAEQVEGALKPLDSKVGRISDVSVRTVPRFEGVGAAGYESRLWEKATCKVAEDPRERLVDPVINVDPITDIEKLTTLVERLSTELKTVTEGLAKLKQQPGR